jgi:hypothetical protein
VFGASPNKIFGYYFYKALSIFIMLTEFLFVEKEFFYSEGLSRE